jgi:hypothetical protein
MCKSKIEITRQGVTMLKRQTLLKTVVSAWLESLHRKETIMLLLAPLTVFCEPSEQIQIL